ncbi:hypothetical protein FOXG_18964 [Fusarium oxysporum f. sp. lycopersici 4287]|uniref:Uncharacterized protein n=2 Tax=Fusarium oxysporum TaxID=5507 RepID=A0A0J9USE9_FUSO4|nr:hypothetical protein FOXG_18964 [Fusarium oxysporum f. sp. lycopersici 4287]EXK38814.1 hypothetical protein FOMG_06346 [Fusarium oxysporum f. sp. melonis 26406]KNB01883.1 hypothetical protein FOXG_18964 [Fusarium oxysporum f. sp. lycopersici 4287]
MASFLAILFRTITSIQPKSTILLTLTAQLTMLTSKLQPTLPTALPGLRFSLGIMHVFMALIHTSVDWSIYKRDCRWIVVVPRMIGLRVGVKTNMRRARGR